MVVSNRLPVDRVVTESGAAEWRRSPGGLVTALEPLMRASDGAWVGWPGQPDLDVEPFDNDGISIVPVPLSGDELAKYYEGFSNATLWPLYHDVIAPPEYHRDWWEAYQTVNRRFADKAADAAEQGATVWVHDYQLQLVPRMLRQARPDLLIGFFNHIPFPAYGLFSQLPWRTEVIEGMLGADIVGFQRMGDAGNFLQAVRRRTGYRTRGPVIEVPERDGLPQRFVVAKEFPISIDAREFERLARTRQVQRRAQEIRKELGSPRTVLLGVDRLDYTKGIGHRIKAFGELLDDGALTADDATLVQVAAPSRERVESYQRLRDEIELTVGRINGAHSTLSHPAITYLHHTYPPEEMAALYLAADVMLVTALRDGMNLVAKEYVAARYDDGGVLVLSEFAGAADELTSALLVNPHDIEELKRRILEAINMPEARRRTRMRALRRRVMENDVARWSQSFLAALQAIRDGSIDSLEPEDVPWRTGRSKFR